MDLPRESQAHDTAQARPLQTTCRCHRKYRLRHAARLAQDADPGAGAKPLDRLPPIAPHRRTLRLREELPRPGLRLACLPFRILSAVSAHAGTADALRAGTGSGNLRPATETPRKDR